MPIPLLTTKLFIPSPRLNLVLRERLAKRLDEGMQPGKRLILVSAPAGFGKTTLTSAWLQQRMPGWHAAWISLDEGDNDPVLFMRYLVASLQKADPTLSGNLESALSVQQMPAQLPPPEELNALLINAVAQNGNKLLLLLDDYHLIRSAEIHAFVQILIEHQPEGMRTVILSREDPPFLLPRLRGRGQVTEIRERDLRFTQAEAEAFFVQSMGLALRPQWVEVLENQTEGWVAGLQLAGLALQESPDSNSVEQFLQTFTGSDRYVIDYLLDEVYNRQPIEIQNFLLRSSILERMCAPLCDHMLTLEPEQIVPETSTALLQQLEHANLFLVPLDNQRVWYRYHHLFAELLRHRLLQEKGSNFVSLLHRTASRWFESNGYILDAIRHAFQTGDWDYSVSLVERYAMRFVARSQVSTLLDWYRQIPESVLRERPLACVYMAWALVLLFREDYRSTVEMWLQRAEQALESEHIPHIANIGPAAEPVTMCDYVTGQVAVIRSQNILAAFHDPVDPHQLIDLSHRALELLPEIALLERSVCAINLALAHLILSQTKEAEEELARAQQVMLEAGNYFGAVTTVWYQARLAFYQGDLNRAEVICRDGMERIHSLSDTVEQHPPAIRSIYVAQAIIYFEQNHLDEAEQLLERSLDSTGWASWVELWAFFLLARLQQIKGKPTATLQILDRMEKMGPQHAVCAAGLRVLQHLMETPLDDEAFHQARTWAQAHAPDQTTYGIVTGLGPYNCDALYIKNITWARVQIELGESQSALEFLEPVLVVARQNKLVYRVVELSLLKAMALGSAQAALPLADGVRKAALDSVREALSLSETFGYLRVFDQGPALDRLLAEIAQEELHSETVLELARAFGRTFLDGTAPGERLESKKLQPAAKQMQLKHGDLIEPLSVRELEVLHLIASGFSNADIAARLVIALGTVKRHINNIYGKLEVESRTQAVDRARKIGILP